MLEYNCQVRLFGLFNFMTDPVIIASFSGGPHASIQLVIDKLLLFVLIFASVYLIH